MKRGDVILIAVPFVGATGVKVRPAVVIQNDSLNMTIRETVIAAVTSNLANRHQQHQLYIDISTVDGQATGLLTDSVVRCDRLHTVPQSDIRKIVGCLSSTLISELNDCLKSALGIV